MVQLVTQLRLSGEDHYESFTDGWGGLSSESPYFLPWEPSRVEDPPSSLRDIRTLMSCQCVFFVGLADTL